MAILDHFPIKIRQLTVREILLCYHYTTPLYACPPCRGTRNRTWTSRLAVEVTLAYGTYLIKLFGPPTRNRTWVSGLEDHGIVHYAIEGWTPYQDSNLDPKIRSLRCYTLHHKGFGSTTWIRTRKS